MNRFLNFTGSEKAMIALGPLVLPLGTLVAAVMAYFGLGDMPEPVQIKDAIVFFLVTVIFARGVWQVPNSDVVKADTVEVKIPETSPAEVTVAPTTTRAAKPKKPAVKKPKVDTEVEPTKTVIEENPVL